MTKQRFNGMSFTLDITDNTAVAKRNGRPDGWLQGDVEASGTLTVDRDGMRALKELASSAGSWQGIEPFDISSYASAGDDEFKVEAFGCKLRVNKLLDIDKSSTDEALFELPYDVTSPDFVNIDDVPYLNKIEE